LVRVPDASAIDAHAGRGRAFGLGPLRLSGGEVGAAATYRVVNEVKFYVECCN
jgi:hypothetical protein